MAFREKEILDLEGVTYVYIYFIASHRIDRLQHRISRDNELNNIIVHVLFVCVIWVRFFLGLIRTYITHPSRNEIAKETEMSRKTPWLTPEIMIKGNMVGKIIRQY
ncbi:hypothetical protein VTN00DRAFT_6205 [Thermoascus crustaceus]|uniref:uncharacterized protein n=1 Tax=Thermoascus crustaceus TaxID=5088 RepID=UPI003742CF7F